MDQGAPLSAFPRVFGKYTLLALLSAGGMAEVFLALQRSTHGFEKLVVIKRILPSKSQNQTFVDMFQREARIAAPLSHRNIVQTFDAGELDGTFFIAMEHVHGEDLRAILRAIQDGRKDALPLEHALHVALGVCSALSYLHEKRDLTGAELHIVHGDVSAPNLILSFTGDVKVVDFGIATSRGDGWPDPRKGSVKQRQIKGKTKYMSPEQAAGMPLDARSDIFSFGVVLFEMTTGQRLLPAGDVAELRSMHNSAYPRPSDVASGYPHALERIVVRALQKDPAERYQSVRAMQADLEAFVKEEQIQVSQVGAAAWMCSLFAAKLVSHHEVLSRMKGRIAAVGAERNRGDSESAQAGPALPLSVAGESITPHFVNVLSSTKRKLGIFATLSASVLGMVAVFFYMQHRASVRLAEAVRMLRQEQGLRLPSAEVRRSSSGAPEALGSLEIVTKPEGCAIWINGTQRSETTPSKVENIALERELHIKLVKEGFEPYRAAVKLTGDAPFSEIEAQLQKLPATIVIGADQHIAFNLWLDGKSWKDHSRIEGLSPDEEHILGFYSRGFVPKKFRIMLQPGETKQLEVKFVRAHGEQEQGAEPAEP